MARGCQSNQCDAEKIQARLISNMNRRIGSVRTVRDTKFPTVTIQHIDRRVWVPLIHGDVRCRYAGSKDLSNAANVIAMTMGYNDCSDFTSVFLANLYKLVDVFDVSVAGVYQCTRRAGAYKIRVGASERKMPGIAAEQAVHGWRQTLHQRQGWSGHAGC
jgi:hypothetical protein